MRENIPGVVVVFIGGYRLVVVVSVRLRRSTSMSATGTRIRKRMVVIVWWWLGVQYGRGGNVFVYFSDRFRDTT